MQPDQTPPPDLLDQLARTESYLAIDPGNPGLLARAIDFSLTAQDPARAMRHALAAMAVHPNDRYLRYRYAQALMARREWEAAAAVLEELLANEADLQLAHSLATCQFWQGRHAAAVATMGPYLDQPELPAEAVTLLVRACHHAGDLAQSLALYRRHRVRLAELPEFLAAASLACLDAGELDEAASLSESAQAHGAQPFEAMVVSATVALAHTDPDLAITRFRQVLALHPREARSWSGLGMASLLKRDLPAAADQLEMAVTLMPGHVGTWHSLGWCRIFQHDLGAAESAFNAALALDRNFGETHGGLAVVAALRGERAQAQVAIDRALGLDPAGLAARYAQMVLSGQTVDPLRFKALALRIMGARMTSFGISLAEVVERHAR